ncbi:MAG: 50S ribosomal protein L35 [Spirochaetes bacterium]|nr:50S ribosomal protein L35 [Spirochaetota bacterium]
MPKIKTKKAASKRYRITKNGRIVINKRGKRHLLTKKSSKRKRSLRQPGTLKNCEAKRIIKMLPHS